MFFLKCRKKKESKPLFVLSIRFIPISKYYFYEICSYTDKIAEKLFLLLTLYILDAPAVNVESMEMEACRSYKESVMPLGHRL